ncbi:PAS domain S-box protein [Sphingomonas sp. SAFR-052]|uniref:PAS domain S-box protein n=1 Tax=Sphingomonas sp. SAFR-052 TaxID=3436867 RepID=UPI003F80639F
MNEMDDREKQRLAALADYAVLDTPREPSFDEIALLAAKLCDVPIAIVNMIGDGRQFFKAEVGLGVRETPLGSSFCAKAILEKDFLLVPDATRDPRFEANPLVVGEPHIRFYAGALLTTDDGLPIGTLCALDYRPRQLTDLQQEALRVLAKQVMAQLELRRAVEERNRRFEAAAASEQRLRLILNSAHDYAIVTTDEDRHITSWSAGAQATFGWSEMEAIGRPLDDIFTPEDRAANIPALEAGKALNDGCASDVRWHVRADGSRVFMNGSTHPIVVDGERPAGFLKIARNETMQRAQAEELARTRAELVDSEARFRNMADSAPVMMWVTDETGYCNYLNRGWYEFTGQNELEALGHGWLEATHPDDKLAAEEAFSQATAAKLPFRLEYRLRRADGVYRWAMDVASPRFGADGKHLGYVGSVIDIDDRREAEDALRRSSALLEAVMASVPGVIYAKDRHGRMLAANRGTMELVGKPLSQIIGRTDHEFLDDPAQAAGVMANDRRIMSENQTEVVEETVSLPDGTRATWLSTKSPFRNVQGDVVGLVGSSIDISERKRAEERLRQSEAQFRLMADAVPQIVWITDAQGRMEFFNKQWADYVGVPNIPATSGDLADSYVHPDDTARTVEAFEEAQRTGSIFQVEHRIRRADGAYRWFLVRADPYRDERTGAITRWFGASTDIQDRKAAEDALLQLNETLERRVEAAIAERDRTWDNARDLLLVVGTDGIFRAVNPAWKHILGWLPEELVGHSYLDFIHPDEHPSSRGALETASAGELPVYENRYRHKDGSFRWISWVAAPESDLIYASGRDVTADKERQDQLEQAQDQLRQAQKMEAVGQLTGGIAHDFNNLLTGVIGSLDMMQRQFVKGDMSKMERYTTTAITSANRAAALTHRLLAFSRRQPLDPKPTSANRLVTGMEELLRRTIGEAVRLEMVTAGGLWQTLCDPHQLESAILNLAINARDAMPEGGTLTIETCNAHLDDAYSARQREVKPGQYVCICVTDTGVGMTADTIQKAFEPFFTTKPIGQGTGLGLSMIYGFARQSEGYAKIYSELGKGTTFKLYLPRFYGEGEDADDHTVQLGDEHRAEHGEVVLVVEDETAVRALVVDVLEELGYRAMEAIDGPSGLKLLHSNLRIDLLVTDIGLPGLNGRQLADAARDRRPDLKVLFMTGYAENATIANGFLEPGMEMITKPFAIDALATRIRAIIEAPR